MIRKIYFYFGTLLYYSFISSTCNQFLGLFIFFNTKTCPLYENILFMIVPFFNFLCFSFFFFFNSFIQVSLPELLIQWAFPISYFNIGKPRFFLISCAPPLWNDIMIHSYIPLSHQSWDFTPSFFKEFCLDCFHKRTAKKCWK